MVVRRMQMAVRKEIAGRQGKLGFPGRCVQKRYWQMSSPSTAAEVQTGSLGDPHLQVMESKRPRDPKAEIRDLREEHGQLKRH